MKKTSIVAYLCMSILFLCSCEFTKWDNYEDLVGEWHSNDPFIKKSKLIFYKDGTCVVENVPIKEVDPWKNEHYSLLWKEGRGNKKFQEKVKTMDNWNFHGYWVVKEDTLYDRLNEAAFSCFTIIHRFRGMAARRCTALSEKRCKSRGKKIESQS
jgi:hypothetical protein